MAIVRSRRIVAAVKSRVVAVRIRRSMVAGGNSGVVAVWKWLWK